MQQLKLLFNQHSAPEEYDYANLYEAKLIKDKESNIYFALLIYYLIAISTSLNIFRHYYSLIPISIIGYSDFITISSEHEKVVSFVLGVLFAIALIAFYGFA